MKIQTSRESHRADNRYAGVYQQQGRMITDADWNELMDIVTERRRESLGDVVQSGIPREGGLKISLNGDITIHPGHLYAGGILARVPREVTYGEQEDLPDAPGLPENPPYKLYADVWDRVLTSLEDDGVRDAALHGADTCARTQTMVQIKWCPDGLIPEDPAVNPRCGDAPLTLTLRHAATVSDPCDPCAAEELGDDPARIGNYLFRVEVHDAVWNPQQKKVTQFTLKWSSENGAEQYALDATVPEAYQVSDWAYELYSRTTERHLGVHLVTGSEPQRGKLSAGYPEDAGAYKYVRRWDGFVVLNRTGTGWDLDDSRAFDRGLVLTQVLTDSNADGEVVLTNNACTINLRGIKLELQLADHVFVAGDYWTAPVREAVDNFEDPLLESGLPTGIVHRYLTLGRVVPNETHPIADPPDDGTRRRLDFPSLTTLMAKDVGLEDDTCDKLYGDAENVQEALENLCDIEAKDVSYDPNIKPERWRDITETSETSTDPLTEPNTVQDALDTLVANLESSDIGYEVPTCAADAGAPPLLKDLLGLSTGAHTDVRKLWDEVLCRLNAAMVPVDKGLNPPLNVPAVQTIQDALNALAGRGGRGGLAAVLEELANAVGIMPDDPRRRALTEAPVSGDQSLAESTYGMVVDILRIFASFALEFIDLKGTIVTPEGDLRIGTSASVNLLGTLRPEARAFALDQVKQRRDLWPQLSADLKNVVWCVLAEFLAAKGVDPQAVVEMGRLYGGETGYNGPAARLAFLENVYRPVFHSIDLDHTALATLRALVLEFLALLWKRMATDLYIHEPPAITPCPANMRWLQADDVQRVLRRIREPDGLLRIHPAGTGSVPPAPRIAMERLGGGGTWVIRDDSLERYRHGGVLAALAPTELRAGRPCPPPNDLLQFATGFQVRHVAGAVFAGNAALEIVYTDPGVNLPQLILVDVDRLAGGTMPAPVQLPFHRKLQLFADARMVLGDGLHSSVAHFVRQTNVTTTGAVSQDFFVVLEGGFSTLQSTSDGSVLAVYNLTIDGTEAGPSHALIVETKGGRQRLMLISGTDRPWWKNRGLTLLAHTALHPGVAVVGVAHDQIILQVVQPAGSDEDAKWAFLPVRTLAQALWGSDGASFAAFWNTNHPDGSPLFESLDGSVTSTVTIPIRERPDTPLFPRDGGLEARLVLRTHPLPLNPGVVRRAGPAGRDGWLTVLAEDEVLGLYQSFHELLPVLGRRYHVRHARSVLGLVADNRIVMGDVTESALQFELGSVAKV